MQPKQKIKLALHNRSSKHTSKVTFWPLLSFGHRFQMALHLSWPMASRGDISTYWCLSMDSILLPALRIAVIRYHCWAFKCALWHPDLYVCCQSEARILWVWDKYFTYWAISPDPQCIVSWRIINYSWSVNMLHTHIIQTHNDICQVHYCFQRNSAIRFILKINPRGWRGDSVDKSTGCTSKGPEFSSQATPWWLTTIYNEI